MVFFFVGFSYLYKNSEQFFNDREVASIYQTKINNLKHLDSRYLQKELSSKIKIYSSAQDKVIALEGFSSQICKTFSTVEIFFEAYGLVISGKSPEFKITAECIPGQDPAEIALIKIPIMKLSQEKARNAEFKFSDYREIFELINADEWSKTWLLSKIIFKSNSDSKALQVSKTNPIVLEF